MNSHDFDEDFRRRAVTEFLRNPANRARPTEPDGQRRDRPTASNASGADGASGDQTAARDITSDNSTATTTTTSGTVAGRSVMTAKERQSNTEEEEENLPQFPEIAWRGTFHFYREAMDGTTEASDVAHFATFWAACAASLGRRVHCFVGDLVYPNGYICFYGDSGDKKTTAQRRVLQCSLLSGMPNVKIMTNVGSTEGLADALSEATGLGASECTCLFYWEEFAALMARARWSGSTIFEFMVQTFDCPPSWGLNYRRKPVNIRKPTPTVLTATTPEWFWKQAKHEDFYGGHGNRFVYLTGSKKAPLSQPAQVSPDALEEIRDRIMALSQVTPCAATLSPEASRLWDAFYFDWETTDRSALLATAVKRIPTYVRKLAMIYAADEGTLPIINLEQLQAAIAVGKYSEICTKRLLDLQAKSSSQMGELEERFIRYIQHHDGVEVRKMQQTLSKYTGGAEVFNKVILNLVRSDRIEIWQNGRRRAYITR